MNLKEKVKIWEWARIPSRYWTEKIDIPNNVTIFTGFNKVLKEKSGIIFWSNDNTDVAVTACGVFSLRIVLTNQPGLFLNVFELSSAKIDEFEEKITIWEKCKSTEFLVIDGIMRDGVSMVMKQMLIDILWHRFHWWVFTVLGIYCDVDNMAELSNTIGAAAANFVDKNYLKVKV
jgi:hypothetical protein